MSLVGKMGYLNSACLLLLQAFRDLCMFKGTVGFLLLLFWVFWGFFLGVWLFGSSSPSHNYLKPSSMPLKYDHHEYMMQIRSQHRASSKLLWTSMNLCIWRRYRHYSYPHFPQKAECEICIWEVVPENT